MKRLLLLALCALFAADAGARTLYVDAKRPNNKGNALSAKKAKKTLQAAINVAKKGDTILVFPGAYTPIKTKNKKVTIKSAKGKGQTYIQAAVDGVCLADLGVWQKNQRGYDREFKKYYNVFAKFRGGASSALSGFTLRPKPVKFEEDDDYIYDHYAVAATAGGTIKNCTIDHCGNAFYSGWMTYTRTSSGAKAYGTGSWPTVYKSKLVGCTLTACRGGSSDTIKKDYAYALTPESGLGICASTLTRCKIVGNTDGRANDNLHNPFLVHDSKFYNCLIAENELMKADNCIFANCTIAKNSNFAMMKSKVQSCIVYKCGKALFKSSTKNTFTNTFKDDRDPRFVDYAGGEFHLTAKSPCINKGRKVSGTGSVDLDGEKRARGKVDMGCYEYFAAQDVTVKFMVETDYDSPWILSSTKTYSSPKTYGSLPTPKRDNYLFAGWWTAPIEGKQVFASSPVTAYRLYSHWVKMWSRVKTKTTCTCYFDAAYASADRNGDLNQQTIGNFALTIPSKLDGCSVTDIGFWDEVNAKVTSVTIPNTIKNLSLYDCSALKSISIPSSVTSLYLSGCSSLKSISIPSTVTSIGDEAFKDCTSLASVTIPSSVASIGDEAFADCTSLASVTIPSSVTSVGYDLFYNCPKLKTIRLQNGSPLRPGDDFSVPDDCTVIRY